MNGDPLPTESCLSGHKKKDPRATAVVDDPSTALQHNSSLIAKILSYMIESTQDIASLRLISKIWNSSILPYVLRSGVVFDAYKHRGGKAFIEALASEYVYDSDDENRYDSEIDDYDATKTNASDFLKKFEERNAREGVVFVDGMIPSDLHDSLMEAIDDFAQKQDVDYHPHSNEILRDIVHPALYPYVEGISPTTKSVQDVAPVTSVINDDGDDFVSDGSDEKDYWGRPYESSKYQWLPTYFDIEDDGSCKICDYINNLLPRAENEILYSLLARLFSYAVPLFESVLTYGRTMRPYLRDDVEGNTDHAKHMSLRGERLQVVTKIVDYELAPGETYEGVWHVEGMSHEEIVATALYYIDKDEDIKGGDIIFKRAFTNEEAGRDNDSENGILEEYNHQDTRAEQMDEILDGGFILLGRVETLSKRLLVFPNSHVHKVTKIENVDNKSKRRKVDNSSEVTDRIKMKQKRRIVVFFLVNPSKRIMSTREVPIQQEPIGSMSKSDAMMHRLELMKERKYAKENWNLREIHLCEH